MRASGGKAADKFGAPISIGFAQPNFGQVRQQASHKPIEIGAPATLSMALHRAVVRLSWCEQKRTPLCDQNRNNEGQNPFPIKSLANNHKGVRPGVLSGAGEAAFICFRHKAKVKHGGMKERKRASWGEGQGRGQSRSADFNRLCATAFQAGPAAGKP